MTAAGCTPGSRRPPGAGPVDAEPVDLFDPSYLADPAPSWAALRDRCPLAAVGPTAGRWLVTRADDVCAVANDPSRFSSRAVTVVPFPAADGDRAALPLGLPPITADPPEHGWTRRLLGPWLSQRRAAALAPIVRSHCDAVLDAQAGMAVVDAAAAYAGAIPALTIAAVLGLPAHVGPQLSSLATAILDGSSPAAARRQAMVDLVTGVDRALDRAERQPQAGLLGGLAGRDREVPRGVAVGMAALLVLAGIDTTASAIGSAIWELARRPRETAQLRAAPTLLPVAVEELLRLHAPVTMARLVVQPSRVAGRWVSAGDRLLLCFPAANRDPVRFPRGDDLALAAGNRQHLAFGVGPHRCAGSALARMQLQVALAAWLRRYPRFTLADPEAVTWTGGQVRGPKYLPIAVSGKLPS